MNKKTMIRALLSPFFGYLSAMLFLLVAASLSASSDDPDKLSSFIGIAAVVFGALACGLFSRIVKNGIPASFVSGVLYSAPLLILSLILGDQNSMPVAVRALVFALAALVSGLVSAVPSKKKVKHGISDKRTVVNKYIEGAG